MQPETAWDLPTTIQPGTYNTTQCTECSLAPTICSLKIVCNISEFK